MQSTSKTADASLPLISICVCTYRRTEMLGRLIELLDRQITNDLFRFSVVVVDNDADQSARNVIASCMRRLKVPIEYRAESRQNIALARNTSVAGAQGEFVAFIDDDEEPCDDWLLNLYETLLKHRADGVLGPVLPRFEESAPGWAVNGQVFQRPAFKTGTVIPWRITGTGNALIRREVVLELEGPFDPQLGAGGEDTDFFRRAMANGRIFIWSAEAVCHEYVPPERTRVAFQLRRALLRGKIASRSAKSDWWSILKSAVALLAYALALPFCRLKGSHVFVTYLVRAFDHLGKLLAICRIDIVGDKYITS